MKDSNPTDPRATRSRDALLHAALSLLEDRDAGEITATDVVQEAKVSRPTLYQHFGDLTGLFVTAMAHHLQGLFDEALQPGPEDADDRAGIRILLERLVQDASLYQHALHGPSGYPVLLQLSALLAERLRRHDPVHKALAAARSPFGLADFVGHGAVGIVARWLDSPESDRESAADIADRLIALLNHIQAPLDSARQEAGA